ncbi:uncharacterized protein C8R40DRAFT_1084599 [Lentinula edodes]|uniref:uncharacterized protein n=1 Tax=Lentinula edodes TaxID=5353 RepID=UPI001E8D58D4|nr:uncharacterized protein C8R40DRAFT_1089374 [Lentinula edodes]XP_046091212.1 uncharacterized protein C8R40DRAFT_1084599 [Lentinula edodes]KAH7878410.1 hypothetical protein C8R40DRAFT_1089374 [Lentinula edodes]KAH7880118.1 hypothetical protein C8R40DRAFT_1084599 [Lentinula edodes]
MVFCCFNTNLSTFLPSPPSLTMYFDHRCLPVPASVNVSHSPLQCQPQSNVFNALFSILKNCLCTCSGGIIYGPVC